MYNTRCIHVHIHRQYIWHYPDSNVRSCLVFQYSPASTVPNNTASMGNLIRFLLPVCGLTWPRSPQSSYKIPRITYKSIWASRPTQTLESEDLYNVKCQYSHFRKGYHPESEARPFVNGVMVFHNTRWLRVHSAREYPNTQDHTHHNICHPCGCWLQYVHCKQFHCLIADQAGASTSDHEGRQMHRSIL